jgi:glycerate 2-kinase
VVALGATVSSGFAVVSRFVGLDRRIAAADAVVTGEGRLDSSSLAGKVVGGILDLAADRLPVGGVSILRICDLADAAFAGS